MRIQNNYPLGKWISQNNMYTPPPSCLEEPLRKEEFQKLPMNHLYDLVSTFVSIAIQFMYMVTLVGMICKRNTELWKKSVHMNIDTDFFR